MRWMAMVAATAAMAGCGGGDRGGVPPGAAFAEGPVRTACLRSGRDGASSALCGCVQAVADRTLSGRDRGRMLRFYDDPHEAQVVRQSDRPRDEAFWDRYKRFVDVAERACA